MAGFDDDLATELPDLYDEYGEEVIFTPDAGGGDRTITMIVHDAGQEVVEGEYTEQLLERIWCQTWRDAEKAIYGGVDRPEEGDVLRRENDPQPYEYQGMKRNQNAVDWELLYARKGPIAVGGIRRAA